MNLPDDCTMDDLLLRGEVARRKRSHKKRRIKLDGVLFDPNLLPGKETETQKHVYYSSWFTEMLSYPCQKEISKMESFSLWSSVLVYIPIGLYLLLNPSGTAIDVHSVYTEGYVRNYGLHIIAMAFLYIIVSRATSRISAKSVILGTILVKTVFGNLCFFLIHVRQCLPIGVVYGTITLETSLSVTSLLLWKHQSDNASLRQFVKSVWELVKPSNSQTHLSSITVQMLGFLQCILGVVFLVFPNFTCHIFQINQAEVHNFLLGWLSVDLTAFAMVGLTHVLAGGADSRSYNMATVFYRIFLSIPLMSFLGLGVGLQSGFVLFFVFLDGSCAFITFVILCIESRKRKTS